MLDVLYKKRKVLSCATVTEMFDSAFVRRSFKVELIFNLGNLFVDVDVLKGSWIFV